MSLNLDKTDLKNNILIIVNDDGSIQCIPEEGATQDELALFEEFRQVYPEGKPVIPIELQKPQFTQEDMLRAKILKDNANMQLQLSTQQKFNADLLLKIAKIGGTTNV